jgi:dihydrodipicolinate synthase/N-acetylneuraminate lyase
MGDPQTFTSAIDLTIHKTNGRQTEMNYNFRGVYVILPTPFDERGNLDEESLRRVVSFSIECGVHGVVGPANASEAPYLSDSERRKVVEAVIDETKGRVPVVIGVTASCESLAVEWAKHAERTGANFLMAMPPTVNRASNAEIRDYYKSISDATLLPICIQNYAGPGGTPLSAEFMAVLLRDIPRVDFVKEETDLSGPVISTLIQTAEKNLHGVMGGKAGRHLLDEYRRGSCGTMPACEVSDLHVRLWSELEAGKLQQARETYRQLLPLLLFETSYGVAVYKEVLRRRGVIRSAFCRQSGGKQLDPGAKEELTSILDDLRPLLSPKYPLI